MENNFNCIAIYSNKIGFDDSSVQKQELQEFAKQNGLKIQSYVDASKFENRSAEQVCLSLAKAKQAAVLVWRLDCLPKAISTMDDLAQLLAELARAKISFNSVVDELSTNTSASDFLESLFKSWQTFKKNRKITNARASSIKVKAKNVKFKTGRPKIRNDKEIHKLRVAGYSIREIALKIGLSTTAVQRSLKGSRQLLAIELRPQDQRLDL